MWPSARAVLLFSGSRARTRRTARRVRREWKFGTINSNGGYVLGDLLLVGCSPPSPHPPCARSPVHERRLEPVLSLRLNSMVTLVVLFIGCVPSLRRRATTATCNGTERLHTDVVPLSMLSRCFYPRARQRCCCPSCNSTYVRGNSFRVHTDVPPAFRGQGLEEEKRTKIDRSILWKDLDGSRTCWRWRIGGQSFG